MSAKVRLLSILISEHWKIDIWQHEPNYEKNTESTKSSTKQKNLAPKLKQSIVHTWLHLLPQCCFITTYTIYIRCMHLYLYASVQANVCVNTVVRRIPMWQICNEKENLFFFSFLYTIHISAVVQFIFSLYFNIYIFFFHCFFFCCCRSSLPFHRRRKKISSQFSFFLSPSLFSLVTEFIPRNIISLYLFIRNKKKIK